MLHIRSGLEVKRLGTVDANGFAIYASEGGAQFTAHKSEFLASHVKRFPKGTLHFKVTRSGAGHKGFEVRGTKMGQSGMSSEEARVWSLRRAAEDAILNEEAL